MKNKYISKNMRNKLPKSIPSFKSILFLFLGLLFSTTVKSQNCQIMKKIKLSLVFCMLTISNLIFASIVHVPNVNATVAYSTGGGFPTPITLTVDATDIDFTYSDFAGY